MTTEIRVPVLGESITEATIGQWFKKPGDRVNIDEPLVELETDKVSVEVPAPVSGVLGDIHANDGDVVEIGALLATLTEGEAIASTAPAAPSQPIVDPKPEPSTSSSPANSMPPSPAAGKILTEKNMSPTQLQGSGVRGQVLKQDAVAAQPVTSPSPNPSSVPPIASSTTDDAPKEERVRMSKLRQTIARRLKDAQNTAAMLTTFNEVDMGPVMDLRKNYKDLFEKKHGVRLGFMGFFTKAVCHALKELPSVNAEIDGTDIIYKNFCHIGVAVGTDKGLVVPVVRDADQMSLAGIEKTITHLGQRARDNKLSIDEMQGGTFTLTNGGVYGSLMSTPILNSPQSAILGMHKIQERPMVIGGEIKIRRMMYLALSYDHRIVDGKEAVTFLVRIKESLEDPQRLVLDL